MDRLTPRTTLLLCRIALGFGGVGLCVLMLGPFQGLEQVFGLNDKAAHAIAFYCATLGLYLAAPRSRRTELTLAAIMFGLTIEFIQGTVGRSMSVTDLAADAAGALTALVPGMIERLRLLVRTHPDTSFAEIARQDRRRARRTPAGQRAPAKRPAGVTAG